MLCPKCGCLQDKVIDSRVTKEGDSIRRRRECTDCACRFTTHEIIQKTELVVVKGDGKRVAFNPQKIRAGIQQACWKRHVSQEEIDSLVNRVVDEVESCSDSEVSTRSIGSIVMRELEQVDRIAYIRFASIYRDFKDVDEFIDEVHNLTEK